jgi:hypothetical protein
MARQSALTTRRVDEEGGRVTIAMVTVDIDKVRLVEKYGRRSARSRWAAARATDGGTSLHRLLHAGIKSMTRMIATALLVFWVPSVVSALAQVQTSPFLTVNFFSF